MKRSQQQQLRVFSLVLAMLSCLVACRPATSTAPLTGDLLFVGLPYEYSLADSTEMSSAIVSATGDTAAVNYIHVALLERVGDSLYVIDATLKRGVARYPIDTFFADFRLRDGSLPRFDLYRLLDTVGNAFAVAEAKRYLGRGYDLCFLPDNEEQYCSELVQNAFGANRFPSSPMNFLAPDGSMPPYWEQLFARMGMAVPQGVLGTNPNDMARSSQLRFIGQLR